MEVKPFGTTLTPLLEWLGSFTHLPSTSVALNENGWYTITIATPRGRIERRIRAGDVLMSNIMDEHKAALKRLTG